MIAAQQHHSVAAHLKVLVAEDNTISRDFLVRLLSNLGQRPLGVDNGLAALDALAREPFDVVLMDIQMPELDGMQALECIRQGAGPTARSAQGGWDTALPVVAITAHALPGEREKLLAQGFTGYVPKPVEAEELMGALRRAVQGASPQPERVPGPMAGGILHTDKTLARLRGDKAFVAMIYKTFLKDLDERSAAVLGALDAGDLATLYKLTHALKSAAATLDAPVMHQAAHAAAQAARTGDGAAARRHATELLEALVQVRRAIDTQLPALEPPA